MDPPFPEDRSHELYSYQLAELREQQYLYQTNFSNAHGNPLVRDHPGQHPQLGFEHSPQEHFHGSGFHGYLNGFMNIPDHLISTNAFPMYGYQPPPSSPKKAEEPDGSSRPRLTAEQTRILESEFMVNHKPDRNHKNNLASELNLSQEKVVNWFQNRRAKSKQQNRSQKAVELDPGPLESRNGQSFPSTTPPAAAAEAMNGHAEQPLIPGGQCTGLDQQPWPQGSDSFSANVGAEQVREADCLFGMDVGQEHIQEAGLPLTSMELMHPHNDSTQDTFGFGQPLAGLSGDWTGQYDLGMQTGLASGGLLLEPATRLASQERPGQARYGESLSLKPKIELDTALPALEKPLSESFSSEPLFSEMIKQEHFQDVAAQVSPQSSSSTTSRPDLRSDSLSRRNSATFEQAHDVGSAVFPSSSPSDDGKQTLMISRSNLAARRHQRPPALTPRTVSASTMTVASPLAKTAERDHHLRRISSTGRIQKSGSASAQRSPINTTFFQRLSLKYSGSDQYAGEDVEASMPSILPQDQSYPAFGQAAWASGDLENAPQTQSPDPVVPPLSASYDQQSFGEGSHAASPPITPFGQQHLPLVGSWADCGARSAPAHVTKFPECSSPMHGHPNDTVFLAPQPQHPIGSFLNQSYPNIHALPGGQLMIYDGEQFPQVSRPSSGAQFTFMTKPRAELVINECDFPPPEHMVPVRNRHFVWNHCGPKDIKRSLKAQPK